MTVPAPLRVAPATARLLVLVAVLAGLFAMHGLSDHGMVGASDPMTSMTSMASAAATSGATSGAVTTVARVLRPDDGHGPMSHDMAGMCLAVLLALTLLLGAALLRRSHGWLQRVRRACTSPARAARSRAPTPPNRTALSIHRC